MFTPKTWEIYIGTKEFQEFIDGKRNIHALINNFDDDIRPKKGENAILFRKTSFPGNLKKKGDRSDPNNSRYFTIMDIRHIQHLDLQTGRSEGPADLLAPPKTSQLFTFAESCLHIVANKCQKNKKYNEKVVKYGMLALELRPGRF